MDRAIGDRTRTHGLSKTKFYKIWKGMRNRCNNPNCVDYSFYGKRGIKIKTRWHSFQNFYSDMFPSYRDGLTLERINNNKGYSKGNCKWVTRKEQSLNRRSNKLLTYKGETKTVSEWSLIVGIKRDTLYKRIKTFNWSDELILTIPLMKKYD